MKVRELLAQSQVGPVEPAHHLPSVRPVGADDVGHGLEVARQLVQVSIWKGP